MATQAVSKISGYNAQWPLAKETPELDCAQLAKNSCASENTAKANARVPLLNGFLQFLLPRFFFERSSMVVADIFVIFLNIVILRQLAKFPPIAGLFQDFGITFPAPGGRNPLSQWAFCSRSSSYCWARQRGFTLRIQHSPIRTVVLWPGVLAGRRYRLRAPLIFYIN